MSAKNMFRKEISNEIKIKTTQLIHQFQSKMMLGIVLFSIYFMVDICLYATPLIDVSLFNWLSLAIYVAFGFSLYVNIKQQQFYKELESSVEIGDFVHFSDNYNKFKGKELYFMRGFLNSPAPDHILKKLIEEHGESDIKEKLNADRSDIVNEFICQEFKF